MRPIVDQPPRPVLAGRMVDGKTFSGANLPEFVLASAAYRGLPLPARALLVELKRLYDGRNNGDLILTANTAAERLGVTKATAVKAFAALVERGFIRSTGTGGLSGRAGTWALLDEHLDGKAPTYPFLRWKPKEVA